ncbi:MAG TPA: ABC transporter permease [Solirubrobacteraceae bacterium]|jgi:ABC-type nitrate/sulfonate/bicarbonate transport system permease component|nr:ABC transporter permease [Solirubrobacteraceae bacterium]
MAARARRALAAVNWLGIGVIVAVLGAWQLLVSAGAIHYHSLPGPLGIWDGLRDLVRIGTLWPALRHTLLAVAQAWGLAVGVGGVAGLLLGSNRTVASWTNATVDVFRSLPVVAFIPIAILIWGPATKAEVLVAAYAAVWPMLVNTAGGVRGVAPRLHDVARSLRLSRTATAVKIVMPATGAAMMVGARLALGTALVVCVVAEMIGVPLGIGYNLVLEQSADQPARMWAYVLIVGVLGILVNAVLVRAMRCAFPGVSALATRAGR